MRVLLFIALAGFPFLLAKEHAPFQDLAVDEQELIYELVKRLGKSDHIRQLEKRKEESECNDRVSTQKGTIIREVDSVKNGALFLTLYEHIDTNDACVGLCCKNSSCDVAVFENKVSPVKFMPRRTIIIMIVYLAKIAVVYILTGSFFHSVSVLSYILKTY